MLTPVTVVATPVARGAPFENRLAITNSAPPNAAGTSKALYAAASAVLNAEVPVLPLIWLLTIPT